MTEAVVNLISTSKASDNGYRALADLAAAAAGLHYRIIGGHMVQILIHAFPTPNALLRGTSDADAGVGAPVAAGPELGERLADRGYRSTSGNHYELANGEDTLSVDLLVPNASVDDLDLLGGRKFDSAPGLDLAMNSTPIAVDVHAHLRDTSTLQFQVLVPNVECAVVMKTLVRRNRLVSKDITDLASLLEIAFEHRGKIPWDLDVESRMIGLRLDTARELHAMVSRIENGADIVAGSGINSSRFAALIREQVLRPQASRRARPRTR